MVTDAQWEIRNSEAGSCGRGKVGKEAPGEPNWEGEERLTGLIANRRPRKDARRPNGWDTGAGLDEGRGKTGCGEGVAEGAQRLLLNGGKAAGVLTASSP